MGNATSDAALLAESATAPILELLHLLCEECILGLEHSKIQKYLIGSEASRMKT